MSMRLPQDVGSPSRGDRRGVPDARDLSGSARDYTLAYRAFQESGGFALRAEALWGLIARWPESRPAVEDLLHSNDHTSIEDAAGILTWVGCPDDLVDDLVALLGSLPDSSALDSVHAALPSEVTDTLNLDEDGPTQRLTMDALPLGGAKDPFTQRICFLETDFVAATAALSKWFGEGHARPPRLKRVRGSLEKLLDRLEPWEMPNRRDLVTETDGSWTAFFDKGGYAAQVLARRLGIRSVETVFAPNVTSQGSIIRYGATVFIIEDGARGGYPASVVRTVHVSRQPSRWQADIRGEVQPFEDVSRYDRRLVRERFDIEALNEYCEAIGIRRADASFYGPRGLLLTKPAIAPTKSMPSAQWRAEHS